MINKNKFISSVILGISAAAITASPAIAKSKKMEKCYGVAKAGKNDCADLKGIHSCAGAAKIDGDKNEWIYIAKGTCERLVGGKLN